MKQENNHKKQYCCAGRGNVAPCPHINLEKYLEHHLPWYGEYKQQESLEYLNMLKGALERINMATEQLYDKKTFRYDRLNEYRSHRQEMIVSGYREVSMQTETKGAEFVCCKATYEKDYWEAEELTPEQAHRKMKPLFDEVMNEPQKVVVKIEISKEDLEKLVERKIKEYMANNEV